MSFVDVGGRVRVYFWIRTTDDGCGPLGLGSALCAPLRKPIVCLHMWGCIVHRAPSSESERLVTGTAVLRTAYWCSQSQSRSKFKARSDMDQISLHIHIPKGHGAHRARRGIGLRPVTLGPMCMCSNGNGGGVGGGGHNETWRLANANAQRQRILRAQLRVVPATSHHYQLAFAQLAFAPSSLRLTLYFVVCVCMTAFCMRD